MQRWVYSYEGTIRQFLGGLSLPCLYSRPDFSVPLTQPTLIPLSDDLLLTRIVDDKGMVLIACFGLVAHEDDAERATRCAMEIARDLLMSGVTSSAGVTTGEVFCGLIGGETRCEYALIGDVVNMAARLMAATQDEIRCDVATYTRSCKRVVYEHLEPIQVKGKDTRIKVFKPVSGSVTASLSLRKIP